MLFADQSFYFLNSVCIFIQNGDLLRLQHAVGSELFLNALRKSRFQFDKIEYVADLHQT